jgi:hypothetical protein
MVSKKFDSIPVPIIPNTWATTDVLDSLAKFNTIMGFSSPFAFFSLAEIDRNNRGGSGIVIVYDTTHPLSPKFTMEKYNPAKVYLLPKEPFEISSIVLSSSAFLPRAGSIGLFARIGLDNDNKTILWVDSTKVSIDPISEVISIVRSGDGGGGGGLTPARIPAN